MQTSEITELDIRSIYSPRERVKKYSLEPSRTKQQFKDECDINTIISRFLRTGVLDFTSKHEARYGDVTGIEYQAAMLKVAAAKSLFADLPAAIRNRFKNEPSLFLDFVQNDANRAEAEEMGLLKPKAPSAPVVATPPAPVAAATPTGDPKPA